MTKWMLAAGAAALAIGSSASAERGGQGGGKKAQSGQQVKQQRSGGQSQARVQRASKGQASHTQRSSSGSRQMTAQRGGKSQTARTERGHGQEKVRTTQGASRGPDRSATIRSAQHDDGARGRNQVKIENRGSGRAQAARYDRADKVRVSRGPNSEVVRGQGNGRVALVDRDSIVRVRDVDRGVVRVRDIDRDDLFVRRLGYGAGGCPPGLARKPVACMPPGQAAKFVGGPLVAATRFGALAPLPLSMRSLYWDTGDYYYRYGGGYLYRVDRDDALIAAMIPLFGAALIGQPLQPYYQNNYYRPSYFNAFYPNSPYDCYRYGYGYVYETDCVTGLVENVIPTYDYGYGVGQILPASYSYYNVPFAYRSYFVDNDDYYYRYAPGAIYRVDRDTALITTVAALLTGGLTVGQPLPVGYGAYNVPLAYRSTYYDTPDAWYRYDNGYIYAVNPRTRMVNSVAYVIV
jgi:hypothetical protein